MQIDGYLDWGVVQAVATTLATVLAGIAVTVAARQTYWVKRTVQAMESDGKQREDFDKKKIRAYLCITSVNIAWSRAHNDSGSVVCRPYFSLTFANYGETPAYKVCVASGLYHEFLDEKPVPQLITMSTSSQKNTLAPKDQDTLAFDCTSNWYQNVAALLDIPPVEIGPDYSASTEESVYFCGKISYEDVFGINRETSFSFVQHGEMIGRSGDYFLTSMGNEIT